MRITNGMIRNNTLNSLYSNMNGLNKLYAQMSTGKKIQTISDDPIIAGRALKLKVTVLETEQYQKNTKEATSWMEVTEAALDNIYSVTQSIKEKCVYAATGTLTAEDRKSLKADMEQLWEQIVQEANGTYGDRYIFSGYKTDQALMLTTDKTLETSLTVKEGYTISSGTSVAAGSTLKAESVLAAGTVLDKGTTLTSGTVLGSNTVLGDGSELNAGTVLGDGTKLGSGTVLGNGTVLNEGTALGEGTVLNKGTSLNEGTVLGEGTVLSAADATALGLTVPAGETTYTLEAATTVPTGGITLTDNVTLAGETTLAGSTTLTGNTTVAGTTVLKGNTTVVAGTTFNGKTILGGETTLNGDTTLKGQMTIGGATKLVSDLTVAGETSIAAGTQLKDGSTLAVGTVLKKGSINPAVYNQISGQDMKYEVGTGSTITVNTLGMDSILNDYMSLMSEILTVVDASQGDNPTYSTEDMHNVFNKKLEELDGVLTSLSERTAELGSRLSRLEYVDSRLTDEKTTFTQLLSDTEDIDVEETYVEFTSQYAVYQSALQATSKILTNTLADYL